VCQGTITAELFDKILIFFFCIGAFFNNFKDLLSNREHFLKPLSMETFNQLGVAALSRDLAEVGAPEVGVEV
jgi:hypothetical protein